MKRRSFKFRNGARFFVTLALIALILSACSDSDSNPSASSQVKQYTPMPTENSLDYDYDPDIAAAVPYIALFDFSDAAAAKAGVVQWGAALWASADLTGMTVRNETIPGRDGAPDVPIRIYTPDQMEGPVPGLLSIHGGGFATGNMDFDSVEASNIARELGVVVISVDYRLAPENPYPAGLDDCYTALVWMHENAATLNIDTSRIGVAGLSAGGGLAAALALKARDLNGPAICFQFLGFPELDDRLDTVSMQTFVDTPLWQRHNAELSWEYYLGENFQPGSVNVPIYAAPARATNLSGLPPTYISAMEFDPLRDEDIQYALGLLEAGVKVELHVFPGTFHGSYIALPSAVSSLHQYDEMIAALQKGLWLDMD